MKKPILFFLFFLMLLFNASGQNLYLTTSALSDAQSANRLVEDENGNIYMLGTFRNLISFGNFTAASVSSSYRDVYVVKFDRYFHPVWLRSYGSIGEDGAGHLIYHNGSLFFTGFYADAMTVDTFSLPFGNVNSNQGFVIQLDTLGSVCHAMSIGSLNCIDSYVTSIAVRNNKIAICGTYKGIVDFGNGITLGSTQSETNVFVASYDLSYNIQWAVNGSSARGATQGNDGATSVDVDAGGNVYVGGYFGSIPTLGNAVFWLGSQSISAVGGFGFTNFFFAKIQPSGFVYWLRGSGGALPSAIFNVCLYNDTLLGLTGRYSDNANVAGTPLPSSPNEYSKFFAVVDSAGLGRLAIRTGTNESFFSLKKSDDYFYAADMTFSTFDVVTSVMKLHPDSGLIFRDTFNIGNPYYYSFDILPPTQSCGQMKVCGTYFSYLNYHGDTVLNSPPPSRTEDYFYGYFDANGQLPSTPVLSTGSATVCNDNELLITSTVDPNTVQYNWQIHPAGAATMIPNGNNLRLIFDPSFSGTLAVNCYLTNFCSSSPLSDTLFINVDISPVVDTIYESLNSINTVVNNSASFSWILNGQPIGFNNQTSIPCQGNGNYTVAALSSSGCADTLTKFIACFTGINEQQQSGILLSPLPADQGFNVKGFIEEAELIVTDLKGSVVIRTTVNENAFVSTALLDNGIYGYTITLSDRSIKGKLTVLHR